MATPNATTLPPAYQPSAYSSDPSTLRRYESKPRTGGPTWPIAVVIHGGGFNDGDPLFPQGIRDCIKDLTLAGYLVFSVDYRLAPPEAILNQVHSGDPSTDPSGRPPQQSNDIKQQVLSARDDARCKIKKVVIVGGSAGGTHGVWAALDPASTVPGWSAATLPKAVASLSGAYNLSLRLGRPYALQNFINLVTNYTATEEPDYADQYAVSPAVLVTSSTIKPLYLINTDNDSMPPPQLDNMVATLQAHGVPTTAYQTLTIPNSNLHSFYYWRSADGYGSFINQDVINFLNAHVNDP